MKTNKKINWIEHEFKNKEFINIIDLPNGVIENVITDNSDYLFFTNGEEISKENLLLDFIILKSKDRIYSLTMKNNDFYINDIIFKY